MDIIFLNTLNISVLSLDSPRVFFIVFGLTHGYYPTDNISSCDSKANTGASTIKDIDFLLETIWRNLDDDVKDAKRSLISDRFDTNIQEYKTMAFIATGALATTHSLVCMNKSSEILMNLIGIILVLFSNPYK